MAKKFMFPPHLNKIEQNYRQLLWRDAMHFILASSILGLLYSLLTDSFDSFIPFINGLIIGFVCGVGVAWSELVLFRNATRKMNFITLVALKVFTTVVIVTITIFTVILFSRSLTAGKHPVEMLSSEAFAHFLREEDFPYMILYAFGMACLILFTKQMSRKMGRGILFNFISGKYAKPFHEDRIFLFVDLDASSALAENIGDLSYHSLLNDFFCDLAEPVLASKGAIHHYVGDEVVITWKMVEGITSGNCLKGYFGIVEKMDKLREKYKSRFGFIPTFKAALHCGSIVVGEVGDIKSEIVFHGDVINTTSRIERLCSDLNEKLLISGDVLEKLPAYNDLFTFAGNFLLRGKKESTALYRLRKDDAAVVVHQDEACLNA